MSNRSDDGVLELFFRMPWWVDVVLAGLIDLVAEFILPNLRLPGIFMADAAKGLIPWVRIIAVLALAMAPLAYWRERKARK